jgi:hypothetical protein
LNVDGEKFVRILIRAVQIKICHLFSCPGTAAALLDGVIPVDQVIVEQVCRQLRGRRDMLDVDEPTAGLQQRKDLFVDLALARVELMWME